MYIPYWSIGLAISIIVLIYYKKKIARHPYDKLFKTKWLSKRKIRYYQENNRPDSRLNSDYYDYLCKKCYKEIFTSSIREKRLSAEKELVNDLNLCDRLFAFIDDIRYFPEFNEQRERKWSSNITFISWYSEEIRDQVKIKKCYESKFAWLFSDKFELKQDDDILEYEFGSDSDNRCILLFFPPQGKYNKYYPLIIMENEADSRVFMLKKDGTQYKKIETNEGYPKVYLVVRLYYVRKYGINEFLNFKLDEFWNWGTWLEYLLEKMFRVRVDEKNFHELSKQCERDLKDKIKAQGVVSIPWEQCKDYKVYTK